MITTTQYELWNEEQLPAYLAEELAQIKGNEKEIEERFYRTLPFGTGGMRGELGVGTNRMNIYMIRLAAAGLAQHIVSLGKEAMAQGVVVAYDTRHFSQQFAQETACVLGAYGVKSYVFSEPRPTPQLSFAVRHLQAAAGVVITASHNPKQYNGFKVYGDDGAQMVPTAVEAIICGMERIANVFDIPTAEFTSHSEWILETLDDAYAAELQTLKLRDVKPDVSIVYTPLHGAGIEPVRRGLQEMGFEQVHIVEEQAVADADFSTVPYPNPEEASAFELAIKLGKKTGAKILLATDPDADRLGVAVQNDGDDYTLLTGNQLGALVIHYVTTTLAENNAIADNAVVVKTIVTAELGAKIAEAHGIHTENVLTGFKYIAAKIADYEATGEKSFVFGYEESYGYLMKPFARDKDAVQMALVVAEMASYYYSEGKSLLDVLDQLDKQYGYHREVLFSKAFEGKSGQEEMQQLLASYRENPLKELAGVRVIAVEDYLTSEVCYEDGEVTPITLPKENVIKYILEDGSWVAIRPSGTEPKCKFYIGVVGETSEAANGKLHNLASFFK
jgi:phosphoglucomutase